MKDSITKVYLYYLKPSYELYAITTDKKIRDEFELERNMNVFHKVTTTMSGNEFMAFSFKNRNSMLFLNILSDGINDIDFVTTYRENAILEADCIQLEDRITTISIKLDNFPLKKKYRDQLDDILDYYSRVNQESSHYEPETIYRFDTFSLFLSKFKETVFL